MKHTLLIYSSLAALAIMTLAACSTDEIEPWQADSYAWFTDTVNNFSFKELTDVPEGGTALAAIPISVASTVADHDRTLNVEVIRQPADSRTKYEVQTPVVFRAGHIVDTMYVRVTRSAHFDTVHDTIGFRILPSDDFLPGFTAQQKANLVIFNGFNQPSWWGESNYYSIIYFGYFTQLKMQVFYEVTGGADDPSLGEAWSNNINITYLQTVLNTYIEENGIRYPDDDPNWPGQTPVFGSYRY